MPPMASQCRLTAPAAWTTAPEPLKLMYPEADIVMQLSVQIHLGPVHHLDHAASSRCARAKGRRIGT